MEVKKVIVVMAFATLLIGVYNGIAGHDYSKGSFFLTLALIQFYLLRNVEVED